MKKRLAFLAVFAVFTATSSSADLMRISHWPVAMKLPYGVYNGDKAKASIEWREWKMTDGVQNQTPFASGFVVAVRDQIRAKDDCRVDSSSYSPLFWSYRNQSTFKAVYILTNAHVWYNDRHELQNYVQQLNPNPALYTMMVGSDFQLYNSSSEMVFMNYYFPEHYPINTWDGVRYEFNLKNMGVRELSYCWETSRREKMDGLNYNWGCDFALVRVLVPSQVDVKPEKIAQDMPGRETKLKIWFSSNHVSHYQLKNYFGERDQTFIADVDGTDYIVKSGWSGSPVFNASTDEVIGIVSSGWEGVSTMLGAYSIDYIMRNLDVENRINRDYEQLKKGLDACPLRGDFDSQALAVDLAPRSQ
jgi:hypothetical protein